MKLKITGKILKAFAEKHPNDERDENLRYNDDSRVVELDMSPFTDTELSTMLKIVDSQPDTDKYSKSAGIKIRQFQTIKKDPKGKTVSRLEDLAAAMIQLFKRTPSQTIFIHEGAMLPYLVTKIKFEPYCKRTESPANTTMDMVYMHRGTKHTESRRWYSDALRGGIKVEQLLAQKDIYVETPEFHAAHKKSMERYGKVQSKTGAQFTATGEGVVMENRWSHNKTAMEREGIAAKLVMDDLHAEGGEYGEAEGLFLNSFWHKTNEESEILPDGILRVSIPVHPYVKLFDLDLHQHVLLHVDQLIDYVWQPALLDKLILPRAHKELVFVLMDTAREDIDDIIAGKSGGTIVICTGDPGTGNTLTAEVTSEVIKAPLYKVQCSQLGTREEKIEESLGQVLGRATRWGALLLIDEADVYVRSRGTDIQQNAIVGVFLRVLEYYRGILFMTSNRETEIDDAIMSRATVHLKYRKPEAEDRGLIWQMLSTQFGYRLTKEQVEQCVKMFPMVSGRDIKSLLKLGIRFARRRDGKLTPLLIADLAEHKDIRIDEDCYNAILKTGKM